MKALLLAIELNRKYNQMDLQECVAEFEEFSGQKVPKEVIDKFALSGLNNVDFLTSDFLNKYGIKNLLQMHERTLSERERQILDLIKRNKEKDFMDKNNALIIEEIGFGFFDGRASAFKTIEEFINPNLILGNYE